MMRVAVAAWWISATVVKRPKLNRMEASAWAGVRPSARKTCEGSGMPEVQAEPVEAARWGWRSRRVAAVSRPSYCLYTGWGVRSIVGQAES